MTLVAPSISSLLLQLDGQLPGPSLYDYIEAATFRPLPTIREPYMSGIPPVEKKTAFVKVQYETEVTELGQFKFVMVLTPNGWNDWGCVMEYHFPEPISEMNSGYVRSKDPAEALHHSSIMHVDVRGNYGITTLAWDFRDGRHQTGIFSNVQLDQKREHHWNNWWSKFDSKAAFDRESFDEIWKAMMLCKMSIDYADPELKFRPDWMSRPELGERMFTLERQHSAKYGD